MEDYLEILNRFDEGKGYLQEPFDTSVWDGLTEDIKELQKTLKTLLNLECSFSIDRDTERAWYGGLYIAKDIHGALCDDYNPKTKSSAALAVRVSNFGRLTTVFGCNERVLSHYPVESIVQCLQRANFRYIPLEVLLTPYEGVHATGYDVGGFYFSTKKVSKEYTWFDRYFFYPS